VEARPALNKVVINMLGFKSIALGFLASVVLFGCSSGSSTNEPVADSGSKTSSAKKFKIGVSIPSADHGWTAGVKYWAEEEAKKHPETEFVINTAKDPAEQNKQLDAMLSQKIEALVILATESAPVTAKAKQLHDAGVYIVNVDRGFTEPIADVFVAGNNKEFGKKSAEFVAEKLGGKGNIFVLEGIACTVNTDRVEAARAVFQKYPGIKILDSIAADWNQTKANKVAETLLVKHAQVDAIWAQDDDMALGVEQALKKAGRTGVWILGGAGMKDIVKRVMDKDPLFPADITYPPSMIADGIKEAVAAMKAGAKPGTSTKNVDIPISLVTPENAKDYYFPDSVY
jgi:ribose transport system substrate-binding protein